MLTYVFLAINAICAPRVSSVPLMSLVGLSEKGDIVYGNLNKVPCIWTLSSGLTKLCVPAEFESGVVCSVSSNGRVVTGKVWNQKEVFVCRWDAGLFTLVTRSTHFSNPCISSDGSTIVGDYMENVGDEIKVGPFSWNEHTGLVRLSIPKGLNLAGHAAACSRDGRLIVGYVYRDSRLGLRTPSFCQACAWDSPFKCRLLPSPAGRRPNRCLALSCSADGSQIFGQTADYSLGTSASGLPLVWADGKLPKATYRFRGTIHAAWDFLFSKDGSTIVGNCMASTSDDPLKKGFEGGTRAIIWLESKTKCLTFDDYLENLGVTSQPYSYCYGEGMSADGKTFLVKRSGPSDLTELLLVKT